MRSKDDEFWASGASSLADRTEPTVPGVGWET